MDQLLWDRELHPDDIYRVKGQLHIAGSHMKHVLQVGLWGRISPSRHTHRVDGNRPVSTTQRFVAGRADAAWGGGRARWEGGGEGQRQGRSAGVGGHAAGVGCALTASRAAAQIQ